MSLRASGLRLLARGVMLGGKLRPAAPLYILGQCAHGLLSDFDTLATINRGFRDIDKAEDFAAAALALNPKRHCSLHGIFGPLKPAAGDGLPHKILLLGGWLNLHTLNQT